MKTFFARCMIFLMLLSLMAGCRQETPPAKQIDRSRVEKDMLEANRRAVKTETQHIEDFLRRYRWDMTESGSGLRYMIVKEGRGPYARTDDTAVIEYSVFLITGDLIYASAEDGLLEFTVGRGAVISGLEEGILLMKVGDCAKFIIPSHLAYGLIGDDRKIPGKSTLIYDVKLLELK
jgi:FKBP-type peptidyl-prolyl cis-trans isomerase FkpA